jgi:hypothetical protein
VVATTAFRWILATTVSSRPSRTEFQHFSPTFWPRVLAATVVGTSSCRASPTVGNASMDDTDAVATLFFPTDSKSIVAILSIVPFVIQAHIERLSYFSIYVFKHPSSLVGIDIVDEVLNMGGSYEGEGGGTGNDATP